LGGKRAKTQWEKGKSTKTPKANDEECVTSMLREKKKGTRRSKTLGRNFPQGIIQKKKKTAKKKGTVTKEKSWVDNL